MVINNRLKTFFLLLVLAMSLVSCANSQNETQSPHPERQCKTTVDWKGLSPGQSNTKDVIRILGNPSKKGRIKFEDKRISYYAYNVGGGVIADYATDRIFFREDGVIDWMEIIEADRTDRVETVFDFVSLFGNELDVVFSNNTYRPEDKPTHIFAGPTRIYVWSECGMALETLPSSETSYFGVIETGCEKGTASPQMCSLYFRHRYPPLDDSGPHYDVNSIVFMKFYFQPTSYQGFADYYMYKIPFRTWGEYLRALGE